MFFSAPGIIFGFLCCFILYIFMDLFVSMFVVIPMDPTLNSSAITIGLGKKGTGCLFKTLNPTN